MDGVGSSERVAEAGMTWTATDGASERSALHQVRLFKDLPASVARLLGAAAETERFASGETIVEQGAAGDSLYVIVEGEVEIRTRGAAGGSALLARLGQGDVLGELSLLDGAPRSATCVAQGPCTCLRLDRAAFMAMLQQHWPLCEALLVILARRLRGADELIARTV